MSTRCHIVVVDNDLIKYYIYHHHDGYPEGVGKELKEILEKCPSYDWETIMEHILAYDSQYEEDSGIHGDEDYIYEIDPTFDNTSVYLKCYTYQDYIKKDLLYHPIFVESYPHIRKDLLEKYETLEYNSIEEKQAFIDGIWWVEEHPTNTVIKKILTEALNTVEDYSSDLPKWVKEIENKLNNGQGVISDS